MRKELRNYGMVLGVLALAFTVRLVLAENLFEARSNSEGRLVVHEWGTFTSVAGADGAALEWRPLAGPSDLPSFVHTTSRLSDLRRRGPGLRYGLDRTTGAGGKGTIIATVRMETPVLYFYSDRERVVSVRVGFPQGQVTEWYPRARSVRDGIDWGTVRIVPGVDPAFPCEKDESHYYPARETDAAPVRVCMAEGYEGEPEFEKFLFYRGVGTFDLPLEVRLDPEARGVYVTNTGDTALRPMLVYERRGAEAGVCLLNTWPLEPRPVEPPPGPTHAAPGNAYAERPSLGDAAAAVRRAEESIRTVLLEEGLYPREVEAMLATWRDSWFEEGLRVFYILPRSATDSILPLEIDPAPAETVRVLVGRVEIVTPEKEREILDAVEGLSSHVIEVREAAGTALRRHGRFAEPTLRRALERSTDPEVRSRLEAVLQAGE